MVESFTQYRALRSAVASVVVSPVGAIRSVVASIVVSPVGAVRSAVASVVVDVASVAALGSFAVAGTSRPGASARPQREFSLHYRIEAYWLVLSTAHPKCGRLAR